MTAADRPRKLAAGVVVARRFPDGWRWLLLRAYRNWDFPKGVVEPGETPLAAALREVREETSVDDLELRWGEDSRDTEPYAGGKVARFFVGESPGARVEIPPGPDGRPEHHEFRWATRAEADALLVSRLRIVLGWAAAVIESPRR